MRARTRDIGAAVVVLGALDRLATAAAAKVTHIGTTAVGVAQTVGDTGARLRGSIRVGGVGRDIIELRTETEGSKILCSPVRVVDCREVRGPRTHSPIVRAAVTVVRAQNVAATVVEGLPALVPLGDTFELGSTRGVLVADGVVVGGTVVVLSAHAVAEQGGVIIILEFSGAQLIRGHTVEKVHTAQAALASLLEVSAAVAVRLAFPVTVADGFVVDVVDAATAVGFHATKTTHVRDVGTAVPIVQTGGSTVA